MAEEPGAKKKRKSFGGFKNGLKNLGKKNKNKDKNNDTTPKDANSDTSNMSYFDQQQQKQNKNGKHKRKLSLTKKPKKVERPKLPKLDLKDYTFPTEIVPPSESWGDQQYDDADRQVHQYLATKYQNEIQKLSFFPTDIILRFTISQRGMTPFSERKKETEHHFKKYLKYHYDNHYDDVLKNEKLNCNKSLSQIKEDINALPLFIYGQDRQGHPIFWDDGSAYSKDAKLDIFKNDMKRVQLFRARIMKRMHNIKLAASKKYGKMVYKHCLVMDLERFNAKQFTKDRKFHQQNTKDISDLFPEVLHRLYIINAPWAFRSAWKIIQTFLHPVTVEKTKILGKDYIDELQKDINLDMIPHKFGGIGPWEIVYGQEPFSYALSTDDIDFDYKQLPKNTLPIPARESVPDMNKHKAKQQKQMKLSGMKDYGDDDELNFGVDDEKENDVENGNDNNVIPDIEDKAKSAPVPSDKKDEQLP